MGPPADVTRPVTARSKFVLAAGGTGGHVFPAIAVAAALVARGHSADDIWFIVDARPATADAIRRAGFGYGVLPLERGMRRGDARGNAAVVWTTLRSTRLARRMIAARDARVVVGFGAYATLPPVLAARLSRIPVVVHEQNAHPGVVNRVAVRLGASAAISIPGTPLRGSVVTGNPVRPDIVGVERDPVAPPLVGIAGGSLGSGLLNEMALGLHDLWRDRDDIAIEHVAGARFREECQARVKVLPGDRLGYRLVGFEHDMAGLYARASVMITRSGGSVAELAAAGVPSILVPWSASAGDHQSANARAFADAGASVTLTEAECMPERVAREVDALLAEPGALDRMSVAARSLARPDAADAVAALAEARVEVGLR
ncbi:MAG TPA: UDP-N-acetylglucosamine--N-acetylmuramyl-(pentapeptide) pyrophosphoryl-undecaprenol N-acetylglucosamine transferase [Acidimicrobiia bacterium]